MAPSSLPAILDTKMDSHTDTHDETIIALGKAKVAMLIFFSCAFVAAGAWMLSFDAADIRSDRSFGIFFNEPLIAHGFGLAAIVFFALCGLYGLKKMFDKKPGLILNESGIVDNASGVAAGFVPWSEVLGIAVYEIHKQKMLIVGVKDPQKYIARGGVLKRMLNRANHNMSGSPITISAAALGIEFPELLALFERYLQKYGGASAERDA
jgi:hypothetical protein